MNKQYKSVPVEPTKEMIKAACDFDLAFDIETNDEYIPGLYQSMLKAAPQAPVSAELLALPDKLRKRHETVRNQEWTYRDAYDESADELESVLSRMQESNDDNV